MLKSQILVALAFFTLQSCEPYEVQETFQPKLAVYCVLKAGKLANARIEFTQNIRDTLSYYSYRQVGGWNESYVNQALIYQSAKVALFKNGIWVDSLLYNPTTWSYEGLSHKVESGSTYQLVIKANDEATITAKTTVPHPVEIMRLDTSLLLPSDYQLHSLWQIKMLFSDPFNERNYYELSCYAGNDTNNAQVTLAANGIFENIIRFSRITYFSDKLFNGETIVLKLSPSWNSNGFPVDPRTHFIWFCLANVSAEEYKYQKSIEQYYTINGVDKIDAVPVYCNINNGAGIFSSMAESYDTIWFK